MRRFLGNLTREDAALLVNAASAAAMLVVIILFVFGEAGTIVGTGSVHD